MSILQERREVLDRLAELLIEKEEIPGEEVLKLLGVEPQMEAAG